jgi:AcrR family transcriptional regulator
MMPKLKKEYADSRMQEIRKAAWESFMEKGYEKTTMREIARRMNASTGILYTYFKTKGEILKAMQTGVRKRIQNVLTEMNKRDSIRETYAGFFSHEFKWPSDNIAKKNCRGMVGLLAEAMRSKGVRKLMNSSFKDIEEGGAKLIEKGIENGEIHSHVDPKAVAGLFQALEWGLWMQIALIDGLDIKACTDNITKILMGNIWRKPEADGK